jgi:hypothetical protein
LSTGCDADAAIPGAAAPIILFYFQIGLQEQK